MGNMSFIYTRDGSKTLDRTCQREMEKTVSGARTGGNENY